jgi:hypothetical protein
MITLGGNCSASAYHRQSCPCLKTSNRRNIFRLLLVNLGNQGQFWNKGLNLYPYARFIPRGEDLLKTLSIKIYASNQKIGIEAAGQIVSV